MTGLQHRLETEQKGKDKGNIDRRFQLTQKVFPKATKKISWVLMSVYHIYSAEALLNYLWAHRTTDGNTSATCRKALSNVHRCVFESMGHFHSVRHYSRDK